MNGKLRNMTAIYLLCKNKILLLYRQGGRIVNNVWVASAGGHFEENELNDAKSCVLRELNEELGLTEQDIQNCTMRYVALLRMNGEIRQNYYFFAEIADEKKINLKSNEGNLQWFELSEIHSLEMPYTAKYVIQHFCDIGIHNNKMFGGIADGTRVVFTEMPEY